ncbi:sialate O-acetylesterase [Coprobacter fastidiosus]
MKLNNDLLLGSILSLFTVFGVQGKVVLPSILSDNMVLQQQSEVKLWGTATGGSTVTVTPGWGGSYTAKAGEEGEWEIKLPTPKAGGPYSIKFSDGETTTLNNVLIGEVWLCSGQSNMEMPLGGFANPVQPVNKAEEILQSATPATPIRVFTVRHKKSRTMDDDCIGRWEEHTDRALRRTSAVAYFFAKDLYDRLGTPVGIIVSAFSGTLIQPWISPKTLSDFKEIDLSHLTNDERVNARQGSVLYNGMIAPLRKLCIKGAIWYQGESNRSNPSLYERLMPALVKDWRNVWEQGEFPFYYVQIAPYDYEPDKQQDRSGAALREAQLHSVSQIPNSGMVVTLDIGEKNCIHPAEKEKVGQRLAAWALSKTYGIEGISCSGPVYKTFEVSGDKISLNFETSSKLHIIDMEPGIFEIAGADKVFYPAKAEVSEKGKDVIVFADEVKNPVAVRYGYKNYVKGCLFDSEGLPASSFRTDNW